MKWLNGGAGGLVRAQAGSGRRRPPGGLGSCRGRARVAFALGRAVPGESRDESG